MKVKIQVPESLEEITLGQYQKFEKVNSNENKNSNFLLQKMVEIFCNLNLKDIAKLKYNSVVKVTSLLNNLFNQEPKFQETFILNGVEYGFITQLDDITIGEYIDLDTYLSDWQSMHKAMAVLFRPITKRAGDKYSIEEYEGSQNAEIYKDMRLDIAMGSLVFFYNLRKELLKTTLKYFNKQEIRKLTTRQREDLLGSMDGITPYINWLEEVFPELTKSLD